MKIEGDLGGMIYMADLKKKIRAGGAPKAGTPKSQMIGLFASKDQRTGGNCGRREMLGFRR